MLEMPPYEQQLEDVKILLKGALEREKLFLAEARENMHAKCILEPSIKHNPMTKQIS